MNFNCVNRQNIPRNSVLEPRSHPPEATHTQDPGLAVCSRHPPASLCQVVCQAEAGVAQPKDEDPQLTLCLSAWGLLGSSSRGVPAASGRVWRHGVGTPLLHGEDPEKTPLRRAGEGGRGKGLLYDPAGHISHIGGWMYSNSPFSRVPRVPLRSKLTRGDS